MSKRPKNNKGRFGFWLKPGLESWKSPSREEIAMAALFCEAEGSARKKSGSAEVTITQKDPWRIRWLRARFGGKQSFVSDHNNGRSSVYRLTMNGARARGFLLAVFTFMSPAWKRRIKETIH